MPWPPLVEPVESGIETAVRERIDGGESKAAEIDTAKTDDAGPEQTCNHILTTPLVSVDCGYGAILDGSRVLKAETCDYRSKEIGANPPTYKGGDDILKDFANVSTDIADPILETEHEQSSMYKTPHTEERAHAG